jgi:hypothetical protein
MRLVLIGYRAPPAPPLDAAAEVGWGRRRRQRSGAAGDLQREAAEPRVVEERGGALAGEGAGLRDLVGEVVEAEVERDGGWEATELEGHPAGEVVVGEVKRASERGELAEVFRYHAGEVVGR